MRSRLESLLAGAVGAIAVAIVALLLFKPAEAAYIPVPSGAILYFNASSCPTGWAEFTSARGAYIVGRVSAGTLNTLVGTALTNQENRTHTHSTPQMTLLQGQGTVVAGTLALNSVGGALGFYDGSTFFQSANSAGTIGAATYGVAANTSGTQSTTIAPYLQLLVCKKN